MYFRDLTHSSPDGYATPTYQPLAKAMYPYRFYESGAHQTIPYIHLAFVH
jgi:hypothetical protein